jgi:hypothetical protein
MLFAPPPGYNSPFINRQNPQAFNVPGQQGLSPQGYNASTFGTAALGAPQPSWRPQGNPMPLGMMPSPMSQLGHAPPGTTGGATAPPQTPPFGGLPAPSPMLGGSVPVPAPTSGVAPPSVIGGSMMQPAQPAATPNPVSFGTPQAPPMPMPQAPTSITPASFGSTQQPNPAPMAMARALNPAGFGG